MTNAEAQFNNSLRPRKPEGSLGRTAQDGHLDSHTAPELWVWDGGRGRLYTYRYTVTTRAPSLINRTVSVDVKHHVYLLPSGKSLGW